MKPRENCVTRGAARSQVHPNAAKIASERDRLLFLSRCLGVDRSAVAIADLKGWMRSAEVSWPALVAFASHELLAPTLWAALRDKELTRELPKVTAQYLWRAHAVNRVRNDRIRTELVGIMRCLNEADVEPVLLKGAIDLVTNRYTDPAARTLRYLDIFVPRPQHARVLAALASIGYTLNADWLQSYFSELSRRGSIAPVDLHWYISAQRDILPPQDAHSCSIAMTAGDLRFRILSPDHQVVHNVLHSELQDRGSAVGFIWLRQLLDLVAICRHYDEGVDWCGVRDRFARHGLERILVARLYMANRLLDLPMPAGIRLTLAARLHYQRCLSQLRWRWPMAVGKLWATISSQFDARLIDLIYSSGTNRLRLGRDRIRHGIRLLSHHRLNFRGAIKKRGMKVQ